MKDIHKAAAGIEILVEWEGLPDRVDLTWEPPQQIAEDLPGILHALLYTAGRRELKREVIQLSNF